MRGTIMCVKKQRPSFFFCLLEYIKLSKLLVKVYKKTLHHDVFFHIVYIRDEFCSL